MSEIDAAVLEKMEEYNKKVEKIDLELGKLSIQLISKLELVISHTQRAALLNIED